MSKAVWFFVSYALIQQLCENNSTKFKFFLLLVGFYGRTCVALIIFIATNGI